jgi:type IV pilus assembly protein PilW
MSRRGIQTVRNCCRRLPWQAGLTLVELLVSSALGMVVVIAATSLLLSTKDGYMRQDEIARMEETGRYAMEVIGRAVRQAGYVHWDEDGMSLWPTSELTADIAGFDASGVRHAANGIDLPLTRAVNGSDVLALRFFGAGSGANGDGTVLNCAGFGVAAPYSGAGAESARGWSIFYVSRSGWGVPELRCKYRGKSAWASDAIASGVESFQVLYGVDADGDGMPNTYLNATALDALDASIELEGANPAARMQDKNRKTYWKKIVALKVALLVRAASGDGGSDGRARHDLFGPDYGDMWGAFDAGTRIETERLPEADRHALRKVFAQTIQLRNAESGT